MMSNSDCMTYVVFDMSALDALTEQQRTDFFSGIVGTEVNQRKTVAGDKMFCKYCHDAGTPANLDLLGVSSFDYAGIMVELARPEWVHPDPTEQ